jgi:hypothetical protein
VSALRGAAFNPSAAPPPKPAIACTSCAFELGWLSEPPMEPVGGSAANRRAALHVEAFAKLFASGHAVRLCVHTLADREAFAPQDLAALLIMLDLVSHSRGRLLFSTGG